MGYMTIVFILVCLQMMTLSKAWHNNYQKTLYHACPKNEVLNVVLSQHHKGYKDRRWYLSCRKESPVKNCKWTGYVNYFQKMIAFQCPGGGFINGMISYFSKKFSDRRWRFRCCNKPKYHTANCYYTGWKNYYTQDFFLFAQQKYYIRGVTSLFNKYQRDRRFQYQLCRLKKN